MEYVFSEERFKELALTKLDKILELIGQINQTIDVKGEQMSAELDALALEVAQTREVEASAILLLQQLSDLIKASYDDPAAMLALAADLDSQQQTLSAAIAQYTPAEPPAA